MAVCSGAPYWRAFPAPTRYALPLAYRFLPRLADRHGILPGGRLGFAGQEARGVIRDWARTAISGRYAAAGLATDRVRVDAVAGPGGLADPAPLALAAPEQADLNDFDLDHAGLNHLDLEHALQRVHAEVDAVLLQHVWLAPPSKLTAPCARVAVLDAAALGARADHFAWMKQPRRVVDHLPS